MIPAGQTTGSVTITPINDTEVEVFSETVILTVTSVNGGELAAGTQPVVITITDDEAMTLTPSEAEVALTEGGTHEVTLTLPTTFDRKAEVSVISDTPGEGTLFKFSGLTNGKLVFPAGQKTAKFTFESIDDSAFACSYSAPLRFYGFFLDGDKDDPNYPIVGRQVNGVVTFDVTENDPVTANDRIEFEFDLNGSDNKELMITAPDTSIIYKGSIGSHYVPFWFDTNRPLPEGTTTVALMKQPGDGGVTRSFTLSTTQPNVCESGTLTGSMTLNDTTFTTVLLIHRSGVNVTFELPTP